MTVMRVIMLSKFDKISLKTRAGPKIYFEYRLIRLLDRFKIDITLSVLSKATRNLITTKFMRELQSSTLSLLQPSPQYVT